MGSNEFLHAKSKAAGEYLGVFIRENIFLYVNGPFQQIAMLHLNLLGLDAAVLDTLWGCDRAGNTYVWTCTHMIFL